MYSQRHVSPQTQQAYERAASRLALDKLGTLEALFLLSRLARIYPGGYVYAVSIQDTELVKIGKTSDIKVRTQQLQRTFKKPCSLLGYFECYAGAIQIESWLHQNVPLVRMEREIFLYDPIFFYDRFAFTELVEKADIVVNKDLLHNAIAAGSIGSWVINPRHPLYKQIRPLIDS